MRMSRSIGVVGGGAWGTTLANMLASAGPVTLWARNAAVVEGINTHHVNDLYLPGIKLSDQLIATDDLPSLSGVDLLLVATPAQHARTALQWLDVDTTPVILCAKGIETSSMYLMSEVAAEVCPSAPIAILSGPTFAFEVARGLPTAITLACTDLSLGAQLVQTLVRPHFRPYLSDDVIGAEIGGALKNVLAIACGVTEGAGLGQNARAALIARGFAEMTHFGLAKGARAETLSGLSGLGDLVLTCSSTQSRNYTFGIALGQGQKAADILASRVTVAEGAYTAPVLHKAARALGVDMPVVAAMCALLEGSASVSDVMTSMMARPLRSE